MDPDHVSVVDFVDATRHRTPVAAGRVTPRRLADLLDVLVANDRNLFHWALVREEVAADVAIARAARRDD
jgi:hypothetical protein